MRGHLSGFAKLAGIALAVFLAYSNSYRNAFQYDDFHSIVENPHIRSLDNLSVFFTNPQMFSAMEERAMYRPVLLATYAGNYAIGEYSVGGYHWVNMGLHTANAWLVFGLASLIGLGPWGAMLSALCFALHPLQTEAVNYISSRSETLAAFFYLLGLWSYILGRQNATGQLTDVGWTLGALGAYTASLASKAVGVTLPAVAWLAAGLGIISKAKRPRWLDWLEVAGVVVLTLLYLWIRGLLDLWILQPFTVDISTAPVRSWDVQCFTQLKALVYYAYLAVMPVRLTVEHAFFESSWIGDASVWLAALVLGSLGWVWWGMPKRFTLIKFCILAALVALAPATLVPLNVLVNEHRIYLSMAFLSIAWAWCLMPLLPIRGLDENHWVASHRGERLKFRFGTKGIACVFLFLSLLGLGTFQRNKVWLDEISLWQDAVRKAPTMYRTHMHLAGALMKEGSNEEALKHFERAASLAPDVVETHYNLGNAWKEAQNVIKAKDAYERSLALNPQFVAAWVNLAALHQDLKEYGKAENRLLKAEAIDPDAADIKRRLGIIYGLQNRLDAAEKVASQ